VGACVYVHNNLVQLLLISYLFTLNLQKSNLTAMYQTSLKELWKYLCFVKSEVKDSDVSVICSVKRNARRNPKTRVQETNPFYILLALSEIRRNLVGHVEHGSIIDLYT
jgi:hypothetical protein